MLDEASCRAHTITSKPARSIKPPKIVDFCTQSLIMYSNTFAKFGASSCIFWGAHKQSWNIPAILRYWHQHRAWTFTTQSCSHDVARMETHSKMLNIVTMPNENTYTCHAMSLCQACFVIGRCRCTISLDAYVVYYQTTCDATHKTNNQVRSNIVQHMWCARNMVTLCVWWLCLSSRSHHILDVMRRNR